MTSSSIFVFFLQYNYRFCIMDTKVKEEDNENRITAFKMVQGVRLLPKGQMFQLLTIKIL